MRRMALFACCLLPLFAVNPATMVQAAPKGSKALNPQPIPPGKGTKALNPQPIPPGKEKRRRIYKGKHP